MAYATRAELLQETSEARLLELADDSATGTLSDPTIQATLDDQLADATALIDSYLVQRYTVPLATVPTVIEAACTTIALYTLYLRRETVPESRRTAYEDTIRWLEAVAAGRVALPSATAAATATVGGPRSTTDGVDRIFTRTTLANY